MNNPQTARLVNSLIKIVNLYQDIIRDAQHRLVAIHELIDDDSIEIQIKESVDFCQSKLLEVQVIVEQLKEFGLDIKPVIH
jgi:hypothetical protein